jgi:hypothetical protein
MPNHVVLIRYKDIWACYSYRGLNGLAVFSNEEYAKGFDKIIPPTYGTPIYEHMNFDEAVEIARGRPKEKKVRCVMLLDNIEEPVIHHLEG